MLQKLAIGCFALVALALLGVAVVLVLAANGAKEFRIERHVEIRATPAEVFAVLSDLHRYRDWAVDDAHRSTTLVSVGEIASGVGATVEWRDELKGESGKLEVIEFRASEFMAARIATLQPQLAVIRAEWLLTASPTGTRVSWTITGPTRFPLRVIKVFWNPDDMIGAGLERRLGALRTVVETH